MKMTSIFKKASIFAVATILALLMVVSVLPAVFAADNEQLAEGAPTETLAASNITLSGNISMTYYFKGLEGLADTDYIQITVPNQNGDKVTSKVYFSEIKNTYDAEKERWAVTVSVAYAQQTDVIKMQWFKNGIGGKIREKSVKDYADKVLDYAQNGTDAQKELYGDSVAPITNMLNTGAMAQVALKYNVDKLANADLFTAGNPVDGMLPEHFYDVPAKESFDDTNANVTFIGGQVFLQSKINLRVYFNCPNSVTTATVSNGKTTKTVMVKVDDLGRKYVGINNIVATNFNERYTVTVDGESYAYSVLDYAVDTLNSYLATEEQKNTAKALYLFYSATMEYTDDSYTAAPADCQHARTHMDKTGKIVCSDCHKAVANAAIKLDVSSNTAKLTAGEEKEIKLTFAINGNVDITGIIFTPVCDDIDLTFKSVEFANGYFGEFGVNGVVLGENANDTIKAGTFATVTYTAKAENAGTYKIAIKVRQATVGETSVEDLSVIATGYAPVEVIPAACENHPNLKYTNAGSKHIIHCDVCQYVEYADHSFGSTYKDANGIRTYYSNACKVCYAQGEGNTTLSYKLGFTVDAEGNKTEKAPLVVLNAEYLANKTSSLVNVTKSGIKTENGVDYVTFSNNKDAKAPREAYFTVFGGNNPLGETGRYMVIKYRTTYSANFDIWVGANHGKTGPAGSPHSSNFYFTTSQGVLKNDGKWQVVVVDLEAMRNLDGDSSVFNPEDGTTDTYYADYMRFDIFNSNPTSQQTFDVAYIAFSNDIMSLASFDGNDSYLVTANSYKYDYTNTAGKPATDWYANASYTGSTETLEITCLHGDTEVKGCETVCNRCNAVVADAHNVTNVNWTPILVPEGGSDNLQEEKICTACGKQAEVRKAAAKVSTDNIYFNGNFVAVNKFTADHAKNVTTSFGIGGWTAINGGTKKYVYRVNGGEWQNATFPANSLGDISNSTNHIASVNGANLGLVDWGYNGKYPSGIYAKDLQRYANQNITIEFGAVPQNNPGTDENVNAIIIYTREIFVVCTHKATTTTTTENGTVTYKSVCSVCGCNISELKANEGREPLVHLDAKDLYDTFYNKSSSELNSFFVNRTTLTAPKMMMDENGTSFVRLTGNGSGKNAYLYIYRPSTVVTTGQYLTIRYRLHDNGVNQSKIAIYTSTSNGGMTGGDNKTLAGGVAERSDGQWYTLTIDLSKVGGTYKEKDGAYAAKYIRLDVFPDGKSTSEHYFDIQFISLSDSLSDYLYTGDSKYVHHAHIYDTTTSALIGYNPYNGLINFSGDTNIGGQQLVTEENGLSYNRYISSKQSEQTKLLYSNKTVLQPVGKYLSLIYRAPTTVRYNGQVINNNAHKLEYHIHSDTTSPNGPGSKWAGSNYIMDGKWHILTIQVDNVSVYDPATGLMSLRLDYFDKAIAGAELHIASVGFFNSTADGQAWFNDFINTYYPDGESVYTIPDECTEETHLNAFNTWVPTISNGSVPPKEESHCTFCNALLEDRDIFSKGYLNGYGINGTKLNSGSANGNTYSLKDKGAANTLYISGWLGINGGNKAIYYRVNGGEWIKTAGTFSKSTDTNIDNAIKAEKSGITGYMNTAYFNSNTVTGDLAKDYAGQTVTVEFGVCPLNNPGSDAQPNVKPFVTFTNVLVADTVAAAAE